MEQITEKNYRCTNCRMEMPESVTFWHNHSPYCALCCPKKQPEWKDSGYSLKCYHDEHIKFKEVYAKKLDYDSSEIVIQKLLKHFKIPVWQVRIRRTNKIGGGKCYRNGVIKLRWATDFGIVCHELAHFLAYRKYHNMKHNKKMYRIMQKIINYCKRKNYWQDETQKRLAPKPVKPEPTKDEIQQLKIQKKQQALARYEKKLKYYTKLYGNKIKSTKRSLIMLERTIV